MCNIGATLRRFLARGSWCARLWFFFGEFLFVCVRVAFASVFGRVRSWFAVCFVAMFGAMLTHRRNPCTAFGLVLVLVVACTANAAQHKYIYACCCVLLWFLCEHQTIRARTQTDKIGDMQALEHLCTGDCKHSLTHAHTLSLWLIDKLKTTRDQTGWAMDRIYEGDCLRALAREHHVL